MSQPSNFIGIDLASQKFDVSNFTAPKKPIPYLGSFANEEQGFKDLLKVFKKSKISKKNAIICMECTGVYGEALCTFLYKKGYQVVVEPATRIKRAFKESTHKTDKIDSQQIAQYAYRFVDQLLFWKPKSELLDKMQQLISAREQLVKQKTALKNSLHSSLKHQVQSELIIETFQSHIKILEESIKKLEKEMKSLLEEESSYQQTVNNLISVKGVGFLLGVNILVLTEGFTTNLEYRKLSAYIGICPYKYESGKSVKKKEATRKYGPSTVRKLLHLAANTIMVHSPKYQEYRLIKEAQGKKSIVINNNVRNKLLKIMCALHAFPGL